MVTLSLIVLVVGFGAIGFILSLLARLTGKSYRLGATDNIIRPYKTIKEEQEEMDRIITEDKNKKELEEMYEKMWQEQKRNQTFGIDKADLSEFLAKTKRQDLQRKKGIPEEDIED